MRTLSLIPIFIFSLLSIQCLRDNNVDPEDRCRLGDTCITITGRLLTDSGQTPIAGAELELRYIASNWAWGSRLKMKAVTQADGSYLLTGRMRTDEDRYYRISFPKDICYFDEQSGYKERITININSGEGPYTDTIDYLIPRKEATVKFHVKNRDAGQNLPNLDFGISFKHGSRGHRDADAYNQQNFASAGIGYWFQNFRRSDTTFTFRVPCNQYINYSFGSRHRDSARFQEGKVFLRPGDLMPIEITY